jgi:hypothetical protein
MDDNTMLGHLSPVVHPKNWDLIRLPLRKVEGRYVVYVSDNMVRYYDENTLPDKLKTNRAMILAAPPPKLMHESDRSFQKMTIYNNPMSHEFDTIGWRVSETYFCLIVSREILSSLIHGEQNGEDEAVD